MITGKAYKPKDVEEKWLAKWKKSNRYSSQPSNKIPYTIVIPPPM